ncbi:hypothetical protein PAXINDRAFT_9459 [Paxillus involutus ATCC 200175]|nr:hypothetical protein PAXINDRAFT_9459 [Paxillus involutus ATCC 200175]
MAQTKCLTGESALAFLLIHDPEDAEALGLDIALESTLENKQAQRVGMEFALNDVVRDRPALVTVRKTSEQPFKQDITVEVPELRLTFTHSGSFQWSGQHRIADCNRVPGIIYLRGRNPPPERNVGFNAQQFPQYGTGDTTKGHLTIDFWNNRRITAVPLTKVGFSSSRPTTTTMPTVTAQAEGGNQPSERSMSKISRLFFVLYDKPSGLEG